VVFTLPSDTPPAVSSGADVEAGLLTDTAAEVLGLAARVYSANRANVPALADHVIACAVALGGTTD
jgi:hypothetical protein